MKTNGVESYLLEIQAISLPLPVKKFKAAISDKRAHNGHLKYAIDFICPVGTYVYSVLPGRVVAIDDKFDKYGDEPKFAKNSNSVSIQHDKNLFSEYIHLGKDRVFVKVGDTVKQGQKLAETGLSGYMSIPHLHFHVSRFVSKEKWETVPVNFNIKIIRESYLLEIQTPKILYHASQHQGLKYLEAKYTQSTHLKTLSPAIYATDDKSYAAGFCFNWNSNEGFSYGSENFGQWELQIPKRYKHKLDIPCSIYEISSNGFKKVYGVSTPEFESRSTVKVLKEEKYKTARECLEQNNVKIVII